MKKKKHKGNAKKIISFLLVAIAAFFIGVYIKDNYYSSPEVPADTPKAASVSEKSSTPEIQKHYKKIKVNKKYVSVFMVKIKNNEETLVAVQRELNKDENTFDTAIKALFVGPTEQEKSKGMFSEIPSTTKLLSVKKTADSIKIDLSGEFSFDGGTGLFLRLRQLINTAVSNSGGKKVYLYIDGVKAEVVGGDGIMIKQPLDINDKFSQ